MGLGGTADLRTRVRDFRGLDSGRSLMLRSGTLRPNFRISQNMRANQGSRAWGLTEW